MKIFLSPSNIFFSSNIQAKNAHPEIHNTYNLQNDLFIKSTNNISFKGTFNEDYANIKKSMTEYIMNTNEISTKDIEKIIQEYSPTTRVDDIKNVPRGTNIFSSSTGYTQSPTQFKIKEDGTFEVEALPKTI